MTDLADRLREEQEYAGRLGDTLIRLGHHQRAKHEAPHQYDADSQRACDIPTCLAALGEREIDVERVEQVLERWEVDCDPRGNILHSTCDHAEQAEAFARAYAALATPPAAEEVRG